MGGKRAAGVERAVDRVDHDPGGTAVAEADLAALLGDGDERGPLRAERLELGEDRVLAAAVDDQAAVAALTDALVDGAGLDAAEPDRRSPAGRPPCGGRFPASLRENVHRPDRMSR